MGFKVGFKLIRQKLPPCYVVAWLPIGIVFILSNVCMCIQDSISSQTGRIADCMVHGCVMYRILGKFHGDKVL